MKSAIATAVAIAAIGARAQISAAPSVVTEYYDDCSTLEPITVTGTITDLYCDLCTGSMPATVTTYTTVYSQTCPTGGFTPATYTVTETCAGGCTASRGASYVPSGFTTTTVPCGCAESTPVTLTVPYETATVTVAPGTTEAAATTAPAAKVVVAANGTTVTPFTGAASSISSGMTLCAGLAALVGVFAFAL